MTDVFNMAVISDFISTLLTGLLYTKDTDTKCI